MSVRIISGSSTPHPRQACPSTREECDPRNIQPDARPHSEVSEWMEKDPIDRLKMALNTQQGQLTDSEWEAMDQEIIKLVDTAVTFAATSPFPPVEAAGEDVFAE